MAKTIKKVPEVAGTNLLAGTGGSSYAYIYPTAVRGAQPNLIQLKIHNDGDQALDLRVELMPILHEESEQFCNVLLGTPMSLPIGFLAAHEGRTMQPGVIVPQLQLDGIARYQIWINAQNPGVSEELDFRRVGQHPYLEYRFTVERPVGGKKRLPTDSKRCGIWIRWLKKRDWTTTYMQSDVEDPASLKR